MRKIILLIIVLIALAACDNGESATEHTSIQDTVYETQNTPIPPIETPLSNPTPMADTEVPTLLLEQSGISEYGWQVAADFLRDFTTLFVDVARVDWGYEPSEISVAITEEGASALVDSYGNIIVDAPWIYPRLLHYADYFKLFDFDNDGIPEILVHFQQTFVGCYGGFYRIFKYIDGTYRMLEMAAFENGEETWVRFGTIHDLFIDENGRIITLLDSEMQGNEYTHLVFANNRVEFHHIAMPENAWESWAEHHWKVWEQTAYGFDVIDSWMYHNPTIFGTDIAIKPFHPFRELEDELFRYLESRRR